MRKIALVGTGIGGNNAPFGDSEYEIWGLPGLRGSNFRLDRVYEVHNAADLTEKKIYNEKDAEWLAKNLTHINPTLKASFPNAKEIDFEGHIKKFGKYFTSSFSWMFADAITEGVDVISTYGFTLSSKGEYAHQKPGASYMIGWARAVGIEVNVSKDSELMSAPYIYGYEKEPSMLKSIIERRQLVDKEFDRAEQEVFAAKGKYNHLEGVRETLEWFENNFWAAKS